jgi:hypothetical protein
MLVSLTYFTAKPRQLLNIFSIFLYRVISVTETINPLNRRHLSVMNLLTLIIQPLIPILRLLTYNIIR